MEIRIRIYEYFVKISFYADFYIFYHGFSEKSMKKDKIPHKATEPDDSPLSHGSSKGKTTIDIPKIYVYISIGRKQNHRFWIAM